MTSIVGTPQAIDAPYLFEDSGIHKFNGKYYYSYCSNFNTGGNQYGLTGGAINYMVSSSPLGPNAPSATRLPSTPALEQRMP